MLYQLYRYIRARVGLSRIKFLRSRFKMLGHNVEIDLDATFINPAKIEISDDCRIYKGAYIKSRSSEKTGIKLGKGVKIHEYTYVDDYGGKVFLDDFVGIGHHCILGGHGGLYIGKYSMIAGLTYIVPANHNFQNISIPFLLQGETKKGIYIGQNVWIGAGCIILDGVTIGDNSIVGAGSVVTRDIEPNSLSFGIPAEKIRNVR